MSDIFRQQSLSYHVESLLTGTEICILETLCYLSSHHKATINTYSLTPKAISVSFKNQCAVNIKDQSHHYQSCPKNRPIIPIIGINHRLDCYFPVLFFI